MDEATQSTESFQADLNAARKFLRGGQVNAVADAAAVYLARLAKAADELKSLEALMDLPFGAAHIYAMPDDADAIPVESIEVQALSHHALTKHLSPHCLRANVEQFLSDTKCGLPYRADYPVWHGINVFSDGLELAARVTCEFLPPAYLCPMVCCADFHEADLDISQFEFKAFVSLNDAVSMLESLSGEGANAGALANLAEAKLTQTVH